MMFHFFTFMMDATINLICGIYHECEKMKHHVTIFWKYLIITYLSLINIRLHQTSIYMHPCMRFMTRHKSYAIHDVTQVMMY